MIGPKKLSEIRGELRIAFAKADPDPILALEQRLSSCKPPQDSSVAKSLKRLLTDSKKKSKSRAKRRTKIAS